MSDATALGESVRFRSKDREFYLSFLTFEVQSVLFRVPAEPFETLSEVFRDMFSLPAGDGESAEGGSDNAPIVLEGVEPDDFRAFLRYLYPKKRGEVIEFSQKEWTGIHALAHMWGFEEAKEASKAFLVDMDDSLSKFELASKYEYLDWLIKAYKELAYRPESLSLEEVKRIGLEAAFNVAHLRETRLEAQSKNLVLHASARRGWSYGLGFTCPQCISNVANEDYGSKSSFCGKCGITFYEDKGSAEEAIAGKVDSAIVLVLGLFSRPATPVDADG